MAIVFGIFLYDQTEPIDIGATHGVLSMARRVEPSIKIVTIAPTPREVTLTNGLRLVADYGVDNCPAIDVLIVLGGSGWQDMANDSAILSFIRSKLQDTLIVSVCTGALILASAGVLEGKQATTRRCGPVGEATPLELLKHNYPNTKSEEAVYVDNGQVITGGGVTLAIDTTLYVIERMFGSKTAEEVTRLIEYSNARKANALAF